MLHHWGKSPASPHIDERSVSDIVLRLALRDPQIDAQRAKRLMQDVRRNTLPSDQSNAGLATILNSASRNAQTREDFYWVDQFARRHKMSSPVREGETSGFTAPSVAFSEQELPIDERYRLQGR